MGNFEYIRQLCEHIPLDRLYKYCSTAEAYMKTDPEYCANQCRKALEWILIQVLRMKNAYEDNMNLNEMINHHSLAEFVGNDQMFFRQAHYVRKVGNLGSHSTDEDVPQRNAEWCLKDLYMVVGNVLMRLRAITSLAQFDPSLVPDGSTMHVTDNNERPKVDPNFVASIPSDSIENPAPNPQLPSDGLTEAETREKFIDLMLREAGWKVSRTNGAIEPMTACVEVEVEGMPNNQGVGYVDYVLFGPDLKPLALIEAKRTSKSISAGVQQAKLYAQCLQARYGTMPVIYVSNGFNTEVIDGLGYPSRKLYGLHSCRDLQWMIQQRQRPALADLNVNTQIAGREYQIRAVRTVCEHLQRMNRRSLLVMATGTGKTRVSIALSELLMRNGWVKNILFLADRTSLVRQAHKNYVKQLGATTTTCVLSDKKPDLDKNARIMFSTYQTMVNYIETEQKEFSVGRFDLIIIDEAHRSVFGKYGAIFDYFDSLLIGLTATPRNEIDRSTYDLLGMTPDNTFAYEYEQAVADGHLNPYCGLKRKSNIMESGIQYNQLKDDEKEQMQQVYDYEKARGALDPEQEYQRDIEGSEIFSYIYNQDTIDKVLQDLMENGLKVHSGELIGKTIIFCRDHAHAVMTVERFSHLYPHLGPDFCVLIDNQVNYAQNLIDNFELRDNLPQIAVSVDMLDTGIDVPDVLNLVFFKPVHSKIKFMQMIGRGTRLSEDIFGYGKHKTQFLIFDWCGNFDFFSVESNSVEGTHSVSLTERLFILCAQLAMALQTDEHQQVEFDKHLHDELKETLCQQVCQLRDEMVSVRKVWQYVDKWRKPESWVCINDIDIQELQKIIAPLLAGTLQDESALKFDALMLNIMISKVVPDVNSAASQNKVITIASLLQERASIPAVAQRMDTIRMVQGSGFFAEAGLPVLERVREELRDLVKNLVRQQSKTFTLNIEDVVSDGGSVGAVNMTVSYRQRVIDFLAENRELPVLSKIFNLEQLTAEDISQLEHILWEELGTREDYEQYTQDGFRNVAMFIRSIIKVDRKVAMQRFAEFLNGGTLNADQADFLNSIISYVCENGDIETSTIVNEAPFSDYDVMGLFGSNARLIPKYVNMIHTIIGA